jgi:hypothetical protein
MTSEWARFGIEPGWSFAMPHRVRWSECDPFRHAGHRAYFEWFEEARNRYLEAVGLAPLSPDTPGPVIAETGIRYHRHWFTPMKFWSQPARFASGIPASRWNTRCGARACAPWGGQC